MTSSDNPLSGRPPQEVPLAHAPLVRVVAQVRFPLVASVDKRDFIAPFQEAIRSAYPVLRPEESRSVVLGPNGVLVGTQTSLMWRFHDTDTAWRVTLAPDFLALETTRYTNRDDFLNRFRHMLESLVAHVDPAVIDRLGVRYIDRVQGENLSDLPLLVRPEICGIMSTPLKAHMHHALSEAGFDLPDGTGQVVARWGHLPKQGTVDPAAVEPIDEPSWLLDVDAFQEFKPQPKPLDVGAVLQQARGFAERIYTVFRWAVTDEFLRRYGGAS